MPDPNRSNQLSSVANLLGEYFDFQLKSQEQFKAPPKKTVQVADEAGNIFWRNVSAKDLEEGVLAKPAKQKPNYGKQFDETYNIERNVLSDEERTIMDDISNNARKEGISKTEYEALTNVLGRYTSNRTGTNLVQVTAPDGSVTYQPKEEGLLVKPPTVKKQVAEPLVEKLQNLNFSDQAKIDELQEEKIPEVGIEPAIKAKKKGKGIFEFLAKDVKAQPERYYEEYADPDTGEIEKIFIEKSVYEKNLKDKAKRDKTINTLNSRIKARTARIAKAGVVSQELPVVEKQIAEKSKFDKFRVK